MQLDFREIDPLLDQALIEDIGRGDVTSNAVVPEDERAKFNIVNKRPLIVSGLTVIIRVFQKIQPDIIIDIHKNEGEYAESGQILVSGEGYARAILAAERVAINLLQHMCAISTLTRQYVDAVSGTHATILDTRKTTPILRMLEKYSVKVGGGANHRYRLDDGVLIKDNHIVIAGGVKEAVNRARAASSVMARIEVECETLEQVQEALDVKADMIMLDNMSVEQMELACRMVKGRVPVEASGNVTLKTVKQIAETGVNFISVGRLTHSTPSVDISLDLFKFD
ncbi:MAG: carboxylating nicotinate-nucleotide diphosphorylase [Alphaproteobacteria bacterium]|nr:carboxylating nicotinate-nucleotide diphosphorylase [Alphaproteobacteria bacterium]